MNQFKGHATITQRVPHFRGGGLIEFADHDYRAPQAGELLVRIGANAICGTDRGEFFRGSPIIPGHEAAGVVEQAGPGTSTPVGTRGAIYLMDFCGQCRSCLVGSTNQCRSKRQDVGQTSDGGYGRYALVHENHFFPIPDDITLVEATLLLDVMGTSGHALGRAELVRSDARSLLVMGAGPIGLGLVAMARLRHGDDVDIFVTDVSPWRREFAESFGATAIDATDHDAIVAAQPDLAFDSSGRQQAREVAMAALSQRGALICVGHGEGLSIDVSRDLIAPERAVLGSEYFRFDEMPGNLETLLGHRQYLGRIITHQFDVSKIDEAFQLFFSGESGKVVITQELP